MYLVFTRMPGESTVDSSGLVAVLVLRISSTDPAAVTDSLPCVLFSLKTLFYKDCSLGQSKTCLTTSALLSY